MESVLLEVTGHRRSPATMPGYHRGRAPRNKGEQYPADPPTVEEIVAVMRSVGDRADGHRLRALIVLLWRAGLRISEALGLQESDLARARGAVLVRGAGRAANAARSGWTAGRGATRPMARDPPAAPDWRAAMRDPRTDRGTAVGGVGRTQTAAPRSCWSRCQASIRAASATARARGRDGARGRPTRCDPAPARTLQPRDHQHLPPRHREQRDRQHRAWTAIADDLRKRGPGDQAIDRTATRIGSAFAGRPGAPPSWRRAGASQHEHAAPASVLLRVRGQRAGDRNRRETSEAAPPSRQS